MGLVQDPNIRISDEELLSLVQQIRDDFLFSGITMMCGNIRSRGIIVTRDRVRRAIKMIDPLGGALRWPSKVRRRPYSVAGPNSLWHIGKYSKEPHV